MSCIFLTRKCTQRCYYCRIVESPQFDRDMTVDEWKRAFTALKQRGVKFHLILGNEPLLYDGIVELMDWLTNVDGTPYAFYTTSPAHLHQTLAPQLVEAGLMNASCGVDRFPIDVEEIGLLKRDAAGDDFFVQRKASLGYDGLLWYQEHGVRDIHATITISRQNHRYVLPLIKYLNEQGMWVAINTLHWDIDGGFDFFPPRAALEHDMLTADEMRQLAEEIKDAQQRGEIALQNPPGYMDAMAEHGKQHSWHCSKPVIYSVDPDGTMRCCGYRRGAESPGIHVFDLETDEGDAAYWQTWRNDSAACPGCLWSYWWQAEDQLTPAATEGDDFGHRFFQYHANEYFAGGAAQQLDHTASPLEFVGGERSGAQRSVPVRSFIPLQPVQTPQRAD